MSTDADAHINRQMMMMMMMMVRLWRHGDLTLFQVLIVTD